MSEITRKEEMLLKFMGTAIKRINNCLINIHAMQSLLIRKGYFTNKELSSEIDNSEDLPLTSVGKKALKDMIKDFNVTKTEYI